MGKSVIGYRLAKQMDLKFSDFDEEVEKYFNSTIERLKNKFLTDYSYRAEVSIVLKKIISENRDDYVVAMPPNGVRDCYYKILKKLNDSLIIEIQDEPENILKRIEFYDIDSKKIDKKLTEKELKLYLKEIKEDISYFKKFNKRANLHINLKGRGVDESAILLKEEILKEKMKTGV